MLMDSNKPSSRFVPQVVVVASTNRYSQAGTRLVKVTSSYNAEAHTYSLKFSQEVPPTLGQPMKEPMFIPVAIGLLDSSGKHMPLSSVYHDGKLESVACNGQPVFNPVLKIIKGSAMWHLVQWSDPRTRLVNSTSNP